MKCDKSMMRLYAVTDRAWTGKMSLLEQVEAARVRQLVEMVEQVDFQQKVMVVMDVMERQWGWSMLWV